ncbi:hypothetical protein CEE35_01980 [Candidatus Aerophobetes bacterium Ae_b3b]|nr:MAG: hypothetical protein CEE35_01980 [Candidatus Aerophobetes bacterium Ae_b3b]
MKVTVEGNHLVLHFSPALVGDLKHWHFDTFQVTWRDRVADVRRGKPMASFTIDAWGEISKMNMFDTLPPPAKIILQTIFP